MTETETASDPGWKDPDIAALARMREPFPPDQIGKLPKPYRKDSEKGTCRECGGWHGLPAAHLDYVGHADLTARLLDVDPYWTWEPFARDAAGLPMIANGNLWIRLTVCGVTRIGVGDGGSVKEMIGDALRNAAMRFGAALDLWAKGDRDYAAAVKTETVRPEWYTKTLDLIGSLEQVDKESLREWIIQEGHGVDPASWDEDTAKAIRHRAHQIGKR